MKNQHSDQVITELQNCINTFLNQLSAERELLLVGNANDLNKITVQKQDTITQLSKLESQFSPLLDNFKGDVTLNKKWQQTVNLLKTCQQMNAENSSLVNTRLKHTTNTLHQLHSLFDTEQSVTYSEDGNQIITSEPNRSVHA
ncbi:MAG: flagellar export chaperone FlgN [Gammaproteobacteria bacterium]